MEPFEHTRELGGLDPFTLVVTSIEIVPLPPSTTAIRTMPSSVCSIALPSRFASASESIVLSSKPPNPAPRMTIRSLMAASL